MQARTATFLAGGSGRAARAKVAAEASLFLSRSSGLDMSAFLQKPGGFPPLQIGGEGNLLGRAALGLVPVAVGEPVTADVRLGAAEREQGDACVAAVGEAAPDVGGDAGGIARLQGVHLAAVELERQRALEHDVDLFLVAV